jgi:hypothetical protein
MLEQVHLLRKSTQLWKSTRKCNITAAQKTNKTIKLIACTAVVILEQKTELYSVSFIALFRINFFSFVVDNLPYIIYVPKV